MTLTDQLAALQQKSAEMAPQDVRAKMRRAAEDLAASGLAQSARGTGDAAPAFALPNARGKAVALGDLLADGPVVLSFYRGGWCPYCSLELRALQQALPEIEDLGARLVAVSPEVPDQSLTTAEKAELTFEVLSDVGNAVARDFGLVFALAEDLRPVYHSWGLDIPAHNGDDRYEIPIPATYVIAADGTIVESFVEADYTKRMEPANVVAALKALKA